MNVIYCVAPETANVFIESHVAPSSDWNISTLVGAYPLDQWFVFIPVKTLGSPKSTVNQKPSASRARSELVPSIKFLPAPSTPFSTLIFQPERSLIS